MTMTYIPFTGQSVGEQQFNELAHLLALSIGENGVFMTPPAITMNQNSALGSCAVTALGSPNMSVNVASGYIRILGAMFKSTATENLAIGASGVGTDRIDRIILTCTATGSPGIVLSVLAGTPAAPGAAVPPLLTTTATSYQISLAQVLVAAGVSQIVTGAITDERGTSVCAALGMFYPNTDGGLNFGGKTATNLANPTGDQDAETKKHVADTFAPIASPTFTGTVTFPANTTGTTAALGDDSTKFATTEFVNNTIATGSYTGDGTQNRAIPHGLGVTPKLVIITIDGTSEKGTYISVGGIMIAIRSAGSIIEVNAVTIPDSTNFYVGNATYFSANMTGTNTYKWTAFG